jgi:hypothetical protein
MEENSSSSGLTLKECFLCDEFPPTTAAAEAASGGEIAAAFTRHFVSFHLVVKRNSRRKECKYCLKKFEDARSLGLHTVCLHLLRSNFFVPTATTPSPKTMKLTLAVTTDTSVSSAHKLCGAGTTAAQGCSCRASWVCWNRKMQGPLLGTTQQRPPHRRGFFLRFLCEMMHTCL